jgi:hypothetical protein
MEKGMGKISSDQYQVIIREVFNASANDPDAPGSLKKDQLHFRMVMIGIRQGFPDINLHVQGRIHVPG